MTLEEITGHFTYLDELRESGRTNMYGGAQFLQAEQGVPLLQARKVLCLWMDTFDSSPVADRAAKAHPQFGQA